MRTREATRLDGEERELATVTQLLCRRFPTLPVDVVAATVADVAHGYRDARIRSYLPLLVENEARDLLAGVVAAPLSA